MLVDVPVVAADGINRELHQGEPRLRAAWLGPLHLRHPMVFGTLINIFAFLPLLMLTGDKGEFMKSLPIVITISLLAALLVSVTFTPLISYYVLRGQKGFDEGGEVRSFFLFRYVDKGLAACCRTIAPRWKALSSVRCWCWALAIRCWRESACSFHISAASSSRPPSAISCWWTLKCRPPTR